MAYVAPAQCPPIPLQYFDQARASATVKCEVVGKPFNREDAIEVIRSAYSEFDITTIDSIWKTDRFNVVFITFKHVYQAQLLIRTGSIVYQGKNFSFTNYDKQCVTLRVHWVHATIRNSFLSSYFAQFGRVISVEEETSEFRGVMLETGVRVVKIEISEATKDKIPHIVRFGESNMMLITAPGRIPICLRCHMLGHRRTDCPRNLNQSNRHENRDLPPPPPPAPLPPPVDPEPSVSAVADEAEVMEEMSQDTDAALLGIDVNVPTYSQALQSPVSSVDSLFATPKKRKTKKVKRKQTSQGGEKVGVKKVVPQDDSHSICENDESLNPP